MNDNDFPFSHFFSPSSSEGSKNSTENPASPKHTGLLDKNNVTSRQSKSVSSDIDGDELEVIHNEVLKGLKNSVGPQKFSAYFNNTFHLTQIKNNLAIFSVTTNFLKSIIENNFLENVGDAIEGALGRSYEIHLSVTEKSKDKKRPQDSKGQCAVDNKFTIDLLPTQNDLIDEVNATVINHLEDRPGRHKIDQRKTFDNFVVGPSNNMAYASIKAISTNPGKIYPSLYLHGNSGLGKTHLLHAAANKILHDRPNLRLRFVTARDFMTEMVNAMANKQIHQFRQKYSEYTDVLFVDDVHELKNRTGTQNEFFHIFNQLHQKGKQLIFTSDRPPREIDGLEERLKTRFTWGLVLDIHVPDIDTRIAILQKKAMDEDIYLPEDVIHLIAKNITNNIRELEGSLIRLSAYSSIMQTDIDLEVAKEQLKANDHLVDQETKNSINYQVEQMIKIVSSFFKIPVADIKSRVRHKDIAYARHISMYLIHHFSGIPFGQIGAHFSGRDHSSVLHGVQKIRTSLKKVSIESDLHYNVKELKKQISEKIEKFSTEGTVENSNAH